MHALTVDVKKMSASMLKLKKFGQLVTVSVRRPVKALLSTSATDNEPAQEHDKRESKDVDEIASLRDISRMPKRYHDRMTHVLNPSEAPDYCNELHTSKLVKKKLFAHFGKNSGIDAGLLWPSKEQLKETIEFEKEWEPSLQEMWKKVEDAKQIEADAKQTKCEAVQNQMAKMPQLLQQYRARLTKADEKEQELDLKRQALLDEAREYFGYNIDPRDPRFEQMQEKKEEEEKTLKKKKKKEEKMARFMASIK